jgi:hypothetical protein
MRVADPNLLSGAQSGFESGISTWVAYYQCTIAVTAADSWQGMNSLRMTSTASTGFMDANVGYIAAQSNSAYSASAMAKGVSGSTSYCYLTIEFYDASFAYLGRGVGSYFPDTTSGWSPVTLSNAISPSNTAWLLLYLAVDGLTGTGQVHDWDGIWVGRESTVKVTQVASVALTATAGMTVAASITATAIANLREDFPGTTLSGAWTSSGTAISVNERLQITYTGPTASSNHLYTNAFYNLTGGSVLCQWSPGANAGALSQWWLNPMYLINSSDNTQGLYFQYNGGILSAGWVNAAGTGNTFQNALYDPVNHAWLKISESGGTISYWTSPDGNSWTLLISHANPIPVTSLKYQIEGDTTAGGPSQSTVLWVDHINIYVGVVVLTASSGMTVGGPVTEIAAVVESGTAGLTVAASVTEIAAVVESGTAGLTVAASVTELAGVSMSATAGVTVVGTKAQFGVVALVGTTGMTVSTFATRVAAVGYAAVAALNFAGNLPQTIQGQITMGPHASLMVAGVLTQNDSIIMAVASALSATLDYLPKTVNGVVAMASLASLSVPGTPTRIAVVQATAVASLVMDATVRLAGSNVFTAVGSMRVDVTTTPGVRVNMAASTSMRVSATVTRLGPVTPPSLADQIAAVINEDPILLGATGYLDDVYTSRLVGDSE